MAMWPVSHAGWGTSTSLSFGGDHMLSVVRVYSPIGGLSSQKRRPRSSSRIFPRSPAISIRSVPGASVTPANTYPWAPSGYSRSAKASSSTSMSCSLMRVSAATNFGGPASQVKASSPWGAWLSSTPPPSPLHVARHPPES